VGETKSFLAKSLKNLSWKSGGNSARRKSLNVKKPRLGKPENARKSEIDGFGNVSVKRREEIHGPE